ncbi:hypothetical protein ACF0H5_003158 [Mactra antiquata]
MNSKSRVRKIIACTWILPLLVASPFVYCQSFSFTIFSEYGVISREICNDRFNEIDKALYGQDTDRLGEFRRGYFFFLFIVIYVIPSVTIMITCVKIAISLLQPITVENSAFGRKDTSRRQEENKRKVAKMVVVIAITFIIFWSPQYLVSVISQLQTNSFLRESNFLLTMLITHFCGFINSCLNPFIYTAMSHKFRRSFYNILQRIFFCFWCAKFRANRMYNDNARRFTTTYQHTTYDTDQNHLVLTDNVSHMSNMSRRIDRNIFRGMKNENRQMCRLQPNVVKMYTFRSSEADDVSECATDHIH